MKGTWGGSRPGAGRKNRGVVARLRLARSLQKLDAEEHAGLAPLLAAEGAAVARAAETMAAWEEARVLVEIAIEHRCASARRYLDRRAAILEQIRRLAPMAPGAHDGGQR